MMLALSSIVALEKMVKSSTKNKLKISGPLLHIEMGFQLLVLTWSSEDEDV